MYTDKLPPALSTSSFIYYQHHLIYESCFSDLSLSPVYRQLGAHEKVAMQQHHSKNLSTVDSKLSELQAAHGTEQGSSNIMGSSLELFEENAALVSE